MSGATLDSIRRRFHAAQRREFEGLAQKPPLTAEAMCASLDDRIAELRGQAAQGMDVADKVAEYETEKAKWAAMPQERAEWLLLDLFADRYAGFLDRIVATSDALGQRADLPVFVGTYPTERLDACLLPPSCYRTTERLVVIDAGFPIFLNLAAKAMCRCFPLRAGATVERPVYGDDPQEIDRHIEGNFRDLGQPWADASASYGIGRNIHGASRYFTDPRYDPIAGEWLETMELFLIAHEYAHAVFGTKTRTAPGSTLSEWDMGREEEYAADALAARIVVALRKARGIEVGRAMAPVFAFFHALHQIIWVRLAADAGSVEAGDAAFAARFGEEGASDDFHPAPLDRLLAVYKLTYEIAVAEQHDLNHKRDLVDRIAVFLHHVNRTQTKHIIGAG